MTLVSVASESEWVVTLLLQAWNAGTFVGVFEKVVDSKDVAVTIPENVALPVLLMISLSAFEV